MVVRRLDALQRRNRGVGFVLAVVYKFVDDQGGYLAALIAYYAFISLFPLLLLLTTGLGVVLADHPSLQQRLVDSALGEFPIIGDQLGQPRRLSGGVAGVVIGVVGALYGGSGVGNLGVVQAEKKPWHDQPFSAEVTLPPLGVVWFRPSS